MCCFTLDGLTLAELGGESLQYCVFLEILSVVQGWSRFEDGPGELLAVGACACLVAGACRVEGRFYYNSGCSASYTY